jgi:hypothetical protein
LASRRTVSPVDTRTVAATVKRGRRGVDGGENPHIDGAHPLTGRFSASSASRKPEGLNGADGAGTGFGGPSLRQHNAGPNSDDGSMRQRRHQVVVSIPSDQDDIIWWRSQSCCNREARGAVMARAIHVLPDVLMKFPAEYSCVLAAVRRVLFAGDATGARFTAWGAARVTPAARDKGRLADVIRQPPVAAPCMPKEIAATAPG